MTRLSHIRDLITAETALFWFRRDLRLEDNSALHAALNSGRKVLPIFIFDRQILDNLQDTHDARVTFIYDQLLALKKSLEHRGSTLVILQGDPERIFEELRPGHLFANEDYEPYARSRDSRVKAIVHRFGGSFTLYKDHVVLAPEEVLKQDGTPYTVFTPYARAWRQKFVEGMPAGLPSENHLHNLQTTPPLPAPTLRSIGFERSTQQFPSKELKSRILTNYHLHRDYPALEGTSRLSVHLRFGTVSVRRLAGEANRYNQTWLTELIWREFFQMILWHFPYVVNGSFRRAYDSIPWSNNEEHFDRWRQGQTGYPLVDAGMRELNETGFMHNRLRMITASFLARHLLIDWRWGEAYFALKLQDFELASNNGGWQWAAGSGCDAAPYFRIFNPQTQQEKFDPQAVYVRRWVPEWGSSSYPKPIVDHATARQRALNVYQKTLRRTYTE
jgi:deoxyribodipyrimidine photo-lyase